MIRLCLNEEIFEYDIYSLIKAFYPEESISREENSKEVQFIVEVNYEPSQIEIIFKEYELNQEAALERISAAETISIENLDRKETKNVLKKGLYKLLAERTNKELPWGTLTGIRPTKIPYAMVSDGMTVEAIKESMKETYLASDEKIELCIDIAKKEQKIIDRIDLENGYSLYVGIPFCPTTCLYCSFTSYPIARWEKRVDEYLDALDKEIEYIAERMKSRRLNTLYIGGGTPTTLNPTQLERLLSKLTSIFDLSNNQEFTVEAGRPDSLSDEKFKVMKKYGVSRISINPQTMKQETLDLVGRMHTVEQTLEAFYCARDNGFDNINMDLIVGLPGETKNDMKNTLEAILKLRPDSLTVHSLAIKRASRLNILREQYKDYISLNTEEISDMVEAYAKEMDMKPYYLYRQKNMTGNLENVGYARLDKEGIYNILIMEEKQTIFALGAGGATKIVYPDGQRIERIENVKSVDSYIDRVDEMIERKNKIFI
ncbi:MAG: coproporphyrinogen dehydrogenase HemZ [Clostridiales bacterium]|nr:coproporphyrinogen dehydrogenase HemZ [Clostridiales bacterium]